MVAPVLFLDPNMMDGVLLYAFAGALPGGIGSPVPTQLKLTVALMLIILVLLFKPNGLFGTTIVRRV
jgi:branched-chain amino acid transport system permease protein